MKYFCRASAFIYDTYDIDMAILSVRLSVTRWYPVKTAKHIVETLSPLNCPVILVFSDRISLRNLDRIVYNVDFKYTRSVGSGA